MGDKKVRYGSPDPWEKYNKAIGTESEPTVPAPVTSVPETVTPPTQPYRFKPGPGAGKRIPLFEIMDKDTLLKRATRGSAPFSKAELKQGYRKVGAGLKTSGDCPKCKK
jgi:hypothetical protein